MDNEAATRYLAIGEVSDATGLPPHTLRYYESVGLLTPAYRDDSGHRRYSTTTIEWIALLRNLRDSGMTIAEIRRFTSLLRASEESIPDRLAFLRDHRESVHRQLRALQETLDILDFKLATYSTISVTPESTNGHNPSRQ